MFEFVYFQVKMSSLQMRMHMLLGIVSRCLLLENRDMSYFPLFCLLVSAELWIISYLFFFVQYVLRELPSSPVPASCCTALVDAYSMSRAFKYICTFHYEVIAIVSYTFFCWWTTFLDIKFNYISSFILYMLILD